MHFHFHAEKYANPPLFFLHLYFKHARMEDVSAVNGLVGLVNTQSLTVIGLVKKLAQRSLTGALCASLPISLCSPVWFVA